MKKIKTIIFIVLMGLAITIFTRNFFGIAGVHDTFRTDFPGRGWPFSYYAYSSPHFEIQGIETFDYTYFILDTIIWTAVAALIIFILSRVLKRKFFDTLKLKPLHLFTAFTLSALIVTAGIIANDGHAPLVTFRMKDTVFPPCPTDQPYYVTDYSGNCGSGTDILNIPNIILVLTFLFPVLLILTKPIFFLIEKLIKPKAANPASLPPATP